jgi:hypothetical protein
MTDEEIPCLEESRLKGRVKVAFTEDDMGI